MSMRGDDLSPRAVPGQRSWWPRVDAVLFDGRLTVCTQCARRRDLTSDDFLPGVRVAGAATFVAEVLAPDSQALSY